jgi:hypothetical protein
MFRKSFVFISGIITKSALYPQNSLRIQLYWFYKYRTLRLTILKMVGCGRPMVGCFEALRSGLGAVYMVPLTRDSMKCDVF